MYHSFGKSIMVTELYRTQEMQDSYYKDNELYKLNKWQSVHQHWRGVDLSINDYTQNEIDAAVKYLAHFAYATFGKETALFHDIGLGKHLHIQVDNEEFTKIEKY
jgi:hypothetical protein